MSSIPSDSQPLLVLVVDDDAQMRTYIRQCLGALSVRVVEAIDGLDALTFLQTQSHDEVALIICDMVMPRLDGLALKASLAANRRWAEVPVLLITGEAVRPRDGPVLRKPFNARKLRAVVQALLGP